MGGERLTQRAGWAVQIIDFEVLPLRLRGWVWDLLELGDVDSGWRVPFWSRLDRPCANRAKKMKSQRERERGRERQVSIRGHLRETETRLGESKFLDSNALGSLS